MVTRVVIAFLLAGCYHPTPQEGAPCGDGMACPAPFACHDGRCTSAAIDAEVQIDAPPDADLTCSCAGSTLTCASGNTDCVLGCSAAPVAHCRAVVPSNAIDPALANGVSTTIAVTSSTLFDTDTGQITGGITRAPGEGVLSDIGFSKHTYLARDIGVFTIAELSVASGAMIRFKGSRAAALLIRRTLDVAGRIDASAGCGGTDRTCAGPGGTPGIRYGTTPSSPCTGRNGESEANNMNSDGGGGGGGGGIAGAKGGESGTFKGGAGGTACLLAQLEPLFGGGGGGGAGLGSLVTGPAGGGGGGALQITALESITISGVISANGSGGEGGPGAPTDGPGGGGGGAGGAILLEAPRINLGSAILVANGGGGGGAANSMIPGFPGEDGKLTSTPALGGMTGAAPSTPGGNGGAGTTAPVPAPDATSQNNAGGGGGAVGRIFTRGSTAGISATVSPPATSGMLVTN